MVRKNLGKCDLKLFSRHRKQERWCVSLQILVKIYQNGGEKMVVIS